MGQGAAKPIRTVLPADEQYRLIDEFEDEDEEYSIDKLGVSAEENDYPEPRPPDKKSVAKENRSQIENISVNKTEHTVSIGKGQEGEMFSTKRIPDEEFEVELVPVGASFQKSVQKRVKINNESAIFPDEGTRSYPIVKTITRSLSLRDSILSSSLANSSGLLGMTKRETMLADRERYEYFKLMAPAAETSTHRGQFRKFHYDNQLRNIHTSTLEKFRNVEDRLADEIAEKHRDHRAETYTSLIKDLTSDINSERLKVRIILAWMSKQGIGRLQFGPKQPPADTPNGYMRLMQEGQGTFPVFFTLLCRAANLKCAIISGLSKGSHYEVGSKDTELLKNTWNAVYVEGSWQLVHPLWVCKSVANRPLDGWMKLEDEGKRSVASIGKDTPSYNPYFIFTKPEEFIYRNFPDEGRWQLLTKPVTLEQFLEQTYIRPIFFMNDFKLKSEDSCLHVSDTGEACEIKIAFPKHKASDVAFGYQLSMKLDDQIDDLHHDDGESDEKVDDKRLADNKHHGDGVSDEKEDHNSLADHQDDGILNENDQNSLADTKHQDDGEKDEKEDDNSLADNKQYVVVKKSENTVTFEVRFFKTGTYKLRLYGGSFKEFGTKPPWIIDVLLKCNNILPQAEPLPFDPGPVGWGPGPMSESVGLYVPSHVESEVLVTEEEDVLIYFILQNKIKVSATLLHSKIASTELQDFVEISTVNIGDIITLQIRLMFPGKGEFGLQINVRNNQMDVNVCNYIIHTSQKRPFESFYPRRARRILLNAMETCDLDFIEGALEECKRRELPDTDTDVMGARKRFEFLKCKTELYVALLVKRIDVSEHALYRTRQSNLDILLAKEITKVEEHLQKLQKLDEGGWMCEIPEIDRQSLVELSQLRKPRLDVRLVITAMYMLLGIEEENLKDWGKVRKLLRNQQSTLIEIARLEKYIMLDTTRDVTVSESVLDRIQEILANYTVENIRRTDNTAAAYFQWVTSVTEKLKENHQRMESTRLAKASASTSVVTKLSRQIATQLKEQGARKTSLSVTTTSVRSRTAITQSKSPKDVRSLNTSNSSFSSSSVSKRPSAVTRKSGRESILTSARKVDSEMSKRTLLKNTSEDLLGLESPLKKKSTFTSNYKTDESQIILSASQSSKAVNDDFAGQRSLKDNSAKSVLQGSVAGNSLTSHNSSRGNSYISPSLKGEPKQSSKDKLSQASARQESLSKSSTFVQKSMKSERSNALSRTPVSRKDSNITKESVKSASKTLKVNGLDRVVADEKLNNGTINGKVPDPSNKSDGISGRTFFSVKSGSQRGDASRPVSKKSKISVKKV